ncbi:hypothetical protein [Bordetella holmesii]|uniref:Uncharacterized protein n=2 Tax=Bordetella holmesii TaxID=35814 RepID=A0A158M842_9BORD|nr:hypothetical protein [Bordetella holmesii]AHV94409.1 hypothetical protein D560_0009 [Bordetella holmesii ATCC 51541]AIT24713.1 hypothetical protein D558_0012 [Bordetella holmesii 44057]EWM45278.1 hypothetical protein D557_3273 [Bordetella holmesii 70147]EWM49392.1 hypothetical protein D555_0008 [Bordetella holmesii 35009]AMD50745.1 hypothetical protein F783_018120 [Bordetella holmesii F627]
MGALLIFLAGAGAGAWFDRQLTIDACLDAGGRWQAQGVCVHAPQPACGG